MARLIITSLLFSVLGFYAGYNYLYLKYRDTMVSSKILNAKELVVLGGTYLEGKNVGVRLENALVSAKETLDILKTSDELSRESKEKIEDIEHLLNEVLAKLQEHNQRTQSAPSVLGPR